jgi:putative endonuclease
MKTYYVYLLVNLQNNVIYTGITSNLTKRTFEHRNKLIDGFTKKYNVTKLVYFEQFSDPESAISREKQIKAGSRNKKIGLITKNNPGFNARHKRSYKDKYAANKPA